jgi:death on curing protein
MLFPRKDEVVEIHRQLIEAFGGSFGLRDEGLLDSALLAAANRHHYESADIAVCAATYAFHLTRNHPFMDGNKRIGLAVAETFVRLNRGHVSATNDDLVALFMGIAEGVISRDEVERRYLGWVQSGPQE